MPAKRITAAIITALALFGASAGTATAASATHLAPRRRPVPRLYG